jgi:hypothetical protein
MDNDITQLVDFSHINERISKKYLEKVYEKNFRIQVAAEYKMGLFFKNVTLYLEPNLLKAINPTDTNEYRPYVILDFDLVTAELTLNKKKFQFRIQVLGYKSSFVFSTKKDIFNTTIMYIYQFIKSSRGRLVNLCGVSLRGDFYKVRIF